mgnify:CR=1 FL=1
MNLYTLSTYKVNILLKHNKSTTILYNNIGLYYNTSKFKQPITLLLFMVVLHLTSITVTSHIVLIGQQNFIANMSYLVMIPFLFEYLLKI